MLSPAYRLTIGDQRVDTTSEPQASTLVDLDVRLDMSVAADRLELRLAQLGAFTPQREDDAAIELGYGDNGLTQVMAGIVDLRDDDLQQARIIGYGSAAKLLRAFTDETFEEMAAGNIVRDLAARAGVTVASADQGTTFPAYVIDGRKSLYHHMADLAALNGFDLYLDADDALVFEAFGAGNRVHPLRHAAHILALDVDRAVPLAGRVEAWGESPGASAGSESWSWLTKDFEPRRGQAGEGDPLRLIERSALRTPEAAQAAADAAQAAIRARRLQGHVLVLGNPDIVLGDAIRLEEVPDDDLNGTFQVRSIRHRLNKTDGFVTEVGFRSLPNGS